MKRTKKVLALLLSLCLAATMMAGCGGGDDSADNGDGSSGGDKKRITYANGAQPEAMDPVSSVYAKYSILKYNIYCGLARISEDGVAELGYADDYTVNDDMTVWTFHIREGSKFSDGSDLTAHDWVETMKYHCAPETAARSTTMEEYVLNMTEYVAGECEWEDVGFKALDDNTLEITLAFPCTYFLDVACTYVPYKVDVIKENPNWAKNPETYITNGPFRIVELNDQVNVLLEKNPYYYDAENVAIDEVNFVFLDDPAVELAAYKNNEIQVSDNLSAESIKTYRDTDEMIAAERIGVNYLTVNTNRISDNRIRKALAYSINKDALIQILGSTNLPATGLVPYGIHWGDEQWRDKAGDLVTYDIELAKQLLADAGYPGGEGLPTYKYVTQNDEESVNKAQALQSMWKEVGINTEIVTFEPSTYWDVFDTEDWDIAADGWTGDYDDPNTNLFLWEAYREQDPDGTLKDARWVNEAAAEYDRLMKETYTELDYETRMNLFVEAEKVLVDDMPILPVFFYTDTMLVKPEVTGVLKCYIGHVFFQYADIVE